VAGGGAVPSSHGPYSSCGPYSSWVPYSSIGFLLIP